MRRLFTICFFASGLLSGCPSQPLPDEPVVIGTACSGPRDCTSGLCLATSGGVSRCTDRCDDSTACPEGWSCTPFATTGGSVCTCPTCDEPMRPPPPMPRDAGPPRDAGAMPARDSGTATDAGSAPLDGGPPASIPCDDEPLRTEPFVGPYEGRITAYYVTPSDQALDDARARYLACSLRDISAFYRAQTGRTFGWVLAAVPSLRDSAWFNCESGSETCWERVIEELRTLGVTPGATRTLFLVALQSNYNYLAGARGSGTDAGGISVFGPDLYADMIDRRCEPRACTSRLFSAIGEDGDGVAGALASVIGYGLGLPNTPTTSPDYARSVMGEYWHYPRLSFTSSDLAILRANPLLR